MISAIVMLVSLLGHVAISSQSEELVTRLNSTDVGTRMKAVSDLKAKAESDPTVLGESGVQEGIVGLLERENARVAEHTADFARTGKDQLNESYSEYYAEVLGLANRIRKSGLLSPSLAMRLRRALVLGVYNPDSAFAKEIAREGEKIVPAILELTRAVDAPSKWNGFALIGHLFASQETSTLTAPVSASSAASLRAAARQGLLDSAADVRRWAVFAVANAKDKEAIPLLERLAKSDPDVDTGPSKVSVRSRAAEALKRLR